jgi:hypothetical protein
MATKTSTARHIYRQRSTVWLAVISGVTGLLLLLSLARNWADYPRPLFGAWVLLGLAVAWSVFVRPAVLIDAGGVTLRNIVRDVHVPWSELTDVTTRWNLKVVAGDQGYSSWAVSSQVERPKSVSGGLFRVPVPGRLEGVRSAAARPSMTATNVTAQAVAQSILAAKQEYGDAVARGALPAAPDAPVRSTWVPVVMVVLLLPAIAVVTLTLI